MTCYTPEEFKADHPQIFSTEPLSDGRRAFGTVEEVFIHNGESFTHVPIGVDKAAFSMDKDRAGRLFVGGNSLMGVITPDSSGTPSFRSLRPLLPDSLLDYGPFWNTRCDGEGGVYFDAYERIFYYQGDTIEVLRPKSIFYQVHQLSDRIVVEDHDTGLFVLSGMQKEYLPGSAMLAKGKQIKAILPASKGDSGTWTIFTEANGLYRYELSEGKVSRMEVVEGEESHQELREAKVNSASLLEPEENPYGAAYAVGTELSGIYLLGPEGRILIHIGREAGLPDPYIWELGTDRSGNIWATTNNGIALIHTGLPFTSAEKGGLFNGGVLAISRERIPGKLDTADPAPLFLATLQGAWNWQEEEGTFSLIEGTKIPSYALYSYPFHGRPRRMLVAASDQGLLSTSLFSHSQKGPSPARTIFKEHTLALAGISTPQGEGVLQAGRGNLHVLIPSKKDQKHWNTLLSLEKLPEEVHSVGRSEKRSDPDSLRIWAGTRSNGVLCVTIDTAFSGYDITRYDSTDGLPKGSINIFAHPSREGKVLFGTPLGLYRFKEGSFAPCCRYTKIFCDSSRQVLNMKKGVDGEIWIDDGAGSQLQHLTPQGDSYRIDSTVFRALELGALRAVFPEEGRTWLGGDRGLGCYYPDVEVDPQRNWFCRLREVRGSGDSLLFGGSFSKESSSEALEIGSRRVGIVPVKDQPDRMLPTLPYSKNRMEFAFSAAFPTQQKAVEYSYKLSGFDKDWSKWGKEAKKEYTSLPEGSYCFKVKARNIYLEESTTAAFRFRILPPWYRTWSAYGAYTMAGLGILWLIVRLNSRRLLAQKERLEKIVDDRTKEIREQKEEVEKKNSALEEANATISDQKAAVEEQQKEAERQKEKVEEAHKEITQSIDYAQKIQYALLQSEEQVSPHIPEHFILFKPQSQVSGDFYWGKEHKGYFYIAAVDCTGHGVPGAFMSMLGISQLNEIMNTDEELSPGHILNDLRDRVVRELSGSDPESKAKDGMDAALVKIPILNSQIPSKEEIKVEFAGAQNPLYLIRKGIAEDLYSLVDGNNVGATHVSPVEDDRLRPFKKSPDGIEIKGDGQPVGYDEYAKDTFTTISLQLRKGDMLYIFSDGYADQFGGPNGKKFRYAPFKELLTGLHERPLEEQKRELGKNFEDWKGDQEQIDDVVVVGVRL